VSEWLSERWLQYLQEELLLLPMTQGQRKSAERGDARLTFAKGTITAEVSVGAMGNTATATLRIRPYGTREWRRIEAAIAGDPEAARRLLSGTVGPELERLLNQAGMSLFPAGRRRSHLCTCSERAGCRHQRVLAVRAARAFAANPFLWLQVLGRERADLLAAVRAQLADQAAAGCLAGAAGPIPAGVPPGSIPAGPVPAALGPLLDPYRFLATETDPAAIPARPEEAAVPDALLRVLGPLPLAPELNRTLRWEIAPVTRWGQTFHVHQPVEETAEQVLARFYRAVSAGAAELARGERAPAYREDPLPGKRVSPRDRIIEEIVALVDQRAAAAQLGEHTSCVHLDGLTSACPTAAALPWEMASRAVREATDRLPSGYLVLAGRFVGRRDALLSGAAFRHVITWPEWESRRLSSSGDWFLALALVGCRPPFAAEVGGKTVSLFAADSPAPARPGALVAPGAPEPASPDAAADPVFALLEPEVGDELIIGVAEPEPLRLSIHLRRRAERDLLEPLPTDQAAARILATAIAADPYQGIAEADAIQLLLAEGFYRPGRIPDPVWLLPMRAVGEPIRWGSGRRIVASYWGRSSLTPGTRWRCGREDRRFPPGFGKYLAGLQPAEQDAALAMAHAWAESWDGSLLDPDPPPAFSTFLHFLLNGAPTIARRLNLTAEQALRALRLIFRYQLGVEPALARAYEPFLKTCEAVEPFRHRLATLPRPRTPEFQVWEMEGFRWLGPELSL